MKEKPSIYDCSDYVLTTYPNHLTGTDLIRILVVSQIRYTQQNHDIMFEDPLNFKGGSKYSIKNYAMDKIFNRGNHSYIPFSIRSVSVNRVPLDKSVTDVISNVMEEWSQLRSGTEKSTKVFMPSVDSVLDGLELNLEIMYDLTEILLDKFKKK